jgi:hypothetical protein
MDGWSIAREGRGRYGRLMFAKVQLAGPYGTVHEFDAQVPEPPPEIHAFTNPDDGTRIEALLVGLEPSLQLDGRVAMYHQLPDDD